MSSSPVQQNSAWAKVLLAERLLYPCEPVVRFLAHVSKCLPPPADAIDIGFGSGQHLKLFMERGYRAHGTELLEEAIAIGQEILGANQLAGSLILGDIDHPDLQRDFYTLGCVWGAVFLKDKEGIVWNLQHIRQLLKPGGECIINFRTKDNWFYGFGEELSEDHFILDSRAGVREGAHYTFVDESEARHMCKHAGFEITNIERMVWDKDNMSRHHTWCVLWLRRPA